jgi:flagellar basal body-associated protein FliL
MGRHNAPDADNDGVATTLIVLAVMILAAVLIITAWVTLWL